MPFLSQNRVTPDNIKEEDRHGFGVCVNILSETWDFSTHLVEWLELLRGFGVARVMAYTLQVDPVSFCFSLPRCTKKSPPGTHKCLSRLGSLPESWLPPPHPLLTCWTSTKPSSSPGDYFYLKIISIMAFFCRRSSWQTELSIEGRSSYLLTITAFTGFDCLLVW